jgi:hypothetical protein
MEEVRLLHVCIQHFLDGSIFRAQVTQLHSRSLDEGAPNAKYLKLDVLICGFQLPHRPVLRPRMFARTQEFHHGNGELVELYDREQDSIEYTSEIAKFDMFKYPVFREP